MIQRFQKSLDAFIENFQMRWETQPSFRSTWSILGSAVALIVLCSCALLGSNALSGFFSGPSGPAQAKVSIAPNAVGTTYPLSTDQPAATQIPLTSGTPVATVTYSPTATPTVTPTGITPTPKPSKTPNPDMTQTPQPTFTVTAAPVGTWQAGQAASISPITTSPAQQNVQMQIDLQFGNNPNCTLPTQTVQLDGTGSVLTPTPLQQPIPTCFHGSNAPVTATFTVPGYQPDINSSFGTANG